MSLDECVAAIPRLVASVDALAAQVAALQKLLTQNGGERPADLLTRAQVAERLRVSVRTVDRWVLDGKLAAPTGRGSMKRWKVQDLRDFRGE